MPSRLLLVTVATLAFWLAAQMISPIFPLYISDLGAHPFEVGLIIAIPSILSIFLRVPTASIARRTGRMGFITFALLIHSVSLLMYGLIQNLPFICLIRVIHSVAIASFGPVAVAFVSVLSPLERKGETMGTYLTIVALALIIGPLLTAILAGFCTYPQILLISSLPSFIAALTLISFSEYKAEVKNVEVRRNALSFVEVLRRKDFTLICFATLTYSLAQGLFVAFFPIYAEETFLLTASIISLLYMVRGIFNVLVRSPTGKLSDKIGNKFLIIFGMCLIAFSFLLISFKVPFLILATAIALIGVGWGIRAVASINFIGKILPERFQGVGMALFFNMLDIGLVFGSVVGGFLTSFIPLNLLFRGMFIILIPGILLLFFLPNV